MASTDLDLRIPGRDSPVVRRAKDLLAMELAWDGNPEEAIERLAKGDPAKAKRWRRRMVIWATDPEFQEMIGQYAKAMQVLHTLPTLRALHRRAMKGNIPAIKLAFESSGFHNPRVQHEHSGDIQITLKGIDRPTVVDDHQEPIVDAEVVDSQPT